MPAIDKIHHSVRNALIKDGWTVTADPYILRYEELTLFADLAAERILAIVRGKQQIVVEIKSFSSASPVQDLKVALGQYVLYRGLLEVTAPERQLYLAVSEASYRALFSQKAVQLITARDNLHLVVIDLAIEEIVQWLPLPNTAM